MSQFEHVLQFSYFWIIVGWPEKISNHLPERRQSLGASFGVVGLWAETFPLLGEILGSGDHLPQGLLSADRSLALIQGTPQGASPQPWTLLWKNLHMFSLLFNRYLWEYRKRKPCSLSMCLPLQWRWKWWGKRWKDFSTTYFLLPFLTFFSLTHTPLIWVCNTLITLAFCTFCVGQQRGTC